MFYNASASEVEAECHPQGDHWYKYQWPERSLSEDFVLSWNDKYSLMHSYPQWAHDQERIGTDRGCNEEGQHDCDMGLVFSQAVYWKSAHCIIHCSTKWYWFASFCVLPKTKFQWEILLVMNAFTSSPEVADGSLYILIFLITMCSQDLFMAVYKVKWVYVRL